jgi:nucleotide-binding universal stress UspA family protein
MILIAYDGTVHSDHAITVAGALLRGGRAHVLHIWEPLAELPITAVSEVAADAAVEGEQARAIEIAEAGAELARLEGFTADAEAVCSADPATALEDAATRLEADLVLVGSRGLHGLQSLLKGSVSRRVARRVDVPILIVPPPHLQP